MNAFSRFHPAALMTYFVMVLLVLMFLPHPVLSLTALLGAALFVGTWMSGRDCLRDVGFYLPLFLLVALTNPLFSHQGVTPLFFMNGNAVTREAVWYGVQIAVILVAVMLWCKAYNAVMTSDKFLGLFGRVIPQMALVLSMALRYIPRLQRQARAFQRTQRAMGLYTSKSMTDRVRAAARVFSALIGWSLENAVETGRAMRARGYGVGRRTTYRELRFRWGDAALMAGCVVCAVLIGVASAQGALRFYYYPRLAAAPYSAGGAVACAAFAVLNFFPFIFETEERWRWTYYRSKR